MLLCQEETELDLHALSWFAARVEAVTEGLQLQPHMSAQCPPLCDDVAGGNGRSVRPPRGRSAMRSRPWISRRLRKLAAMHQMTLTPVACQMPRRMEVRTMTTTLMMR